MKNLLRTIILELVVLTTGGHIDARPYLKRPLWRLNKIKIADKQDNRNINN